MNELYEEAACEWVARQIRGRGHKNFTRAMVRKPEFGIDQGWPGTDITPGDDPEAALMCEIQSPSGNGKAWHSHGERVYSVAGFLRECSEILRELDTTSAEGQLRAELDAEKKLAEQQTLRAIRAERRLEEIRGIAGKSQS